MEKENQEIYHTDSKQSQKQQLSSLRIFEPKCIVSQIFRTPDQDQRLSLELSSSSLIVVTISPSPFILEESKFYLRERSIVQQQSCDDSSIKTKLMVPPSIENIVIEYQRRENQRRQQKWLLPCNLEGIFNNQQQYSSIVIETVHLTQEQGQQVKRKEEAERESLRQLPSEGSRNLGGKSLTSLKCIEHSLQFGEVARMCQQIEEYKEIGQKILEVSRANKELEKISQFLKNFARNRRELYNKQAMEAIDWQMIRAIMEKEFKICNNL